MASSGPLYPGTGVDSGQSADGTANVVAWTNAASSSSSAAITTCLASADTVYAQMQLGGAHPSDWLEATNYGFSIPTAATINGVLVEILCYQSATQMHDYGVQLMIAGAPAGTNLSAGANLPTSAAYNSYGGSSNTWGNALTPAICNASGFGVAYAIANNVLSPIAYVDTMRITVYYTQPAPTATVSAATSVGASSAVLNGNTNPNGLDDMYFFNYGLTTGYGSVTSTQDAGTGSSGVPVSATVTGLQPNTTYHYQLSATNSSGTTLSGDQTFTTSIAPFIMTWTRAF